MFLFPEQPIVVYEEEVGCCLQEKDTFKRAVEWVEAHYDNIEDISDYLYKVKAAGTFRHEGIHIVTPCTFENTYTILVTVQSGSYSYRIFDITTKEVLTNGTATLIGTEKNITHYNKVLRGEARGHAHLVQPEMIKIDAHIRGVIASLKQHMET